jgi:hypothetical protein
MEILINILVVISAILLLIIGGFGMVAFLIWLFSNGSVNDPAEHIGHRYNNKRYRINRDGTIRRRVLAIAILFMLASCVQPTLRYEVHFLDGNIEEFESRQRLTMSHDCVHESGSCGHNNTLACGVKFIKLISETETP